MRVKWEDWMDAVLLERFADTKNGVLARELGVAVRTVKRHATLLGLAKSAEFMRECGRVGSEGAKRWLEYMRITGQKVRKRPGGRPFEKGHRFEGEVEERRVRAIRERAWDERVREIRGWRRMTRWPRRGEKSAGGSGGNV